MKQSRRLLIVVSLIIIITLVVAYIFLDKFNKNDDNNYKLKSLLKDCKKISINTTNGNLELSSDKIKELYNYKYHKLDNYKENIELAYTLNCQDEKLIYIYYDNSLCQIKYKSGEYDYLYVKGLFKYINDVYTNGNPIANNIITIVYKYKTYNIENAFKVEEIEKELTKLEYDNNSPIASFDLTNPDNVYAYSDEYIVICDSDDIYLIPIDKNKEQRYYVTNNTEYSVSGLNDSKTEKYIKELVGYVE